MPLERAFCYLAAHVPKFCFIPSTLVMTNSWLFRFKENLLTYKTSLNLDILTTKRNEHDPYSQSCERSL